MLHCLSRARWRQQHQQFNHFFYPKKNVPEAPKLSALLWAQTQTPLSAGLNMTRHAAGRDTGQSSNPVPAHQALAIDITFTVYLTDTRPGKFPRQHFRVQAADFPGE